MSEPAVIWLEDCGGDCGPLVGGKALGLGALLREGLRVPAGFAVTTRAYRDHVDANRLAEDIGRLLRECDDSPAAQQRAAQEIRQLFEHSRVSAQLEDELLGAHERLCAGGVRGPRGDAGVAGSPWPVAVRSSATAEDLGEASFAGQQETYLWILGGEQVVRHVVRCWGSLFTPQAIAYRAHRNIAADDLAMGVIVQRMVPAEAAGVMLTIDPVTGDRSQIAIEGSFGLGAAVVGGEVTPDRFCVDKVVLEVRSRAIGAKTVAYRFDPAVQGTVREPVPPAQQHEPCVSDEEVLELARLGKRVERALGRPQDLEWAIGPGESGPREVFLLQARPETVWSQKQTTPLVPPNTSVMDRILHTLGAPGSAPPPRGI
jgi:phosphoenolpyruvate synthase/pyruvate phosphate dikinase